MLHAVIMAGGSGTRFWPQSRQRTPKQFLTLHGDRSLLQYAYDRIEPLVAPGGLLVVTNREQLRGTAEQLPELSSEQIIGEPCGRDTAACINLAAALIAKKDPDAYLIVLAADHLIQPQKAFSAAIRAAHAFLRRRPDALLTFGVPPTSPSTAYGYLARDVSSAPAIVDRVEVHPLLSFHEKPNSATAEQFLVSGAHYWNSGIFAWRAETILIELRRFKPELAAGIDRIVAAWDSADRDAVFAREYEKAEKTSIDYAVMEPTKLPKFMIAAPFQWDDVGSWLALERIRDKDAAGNIVIGEHVGLETTDCIVVGRPGHVVATLGVGDLIIVHTPDATLVADRRHEQSVKKLLDLLRERGWNQYI